ncbi:hypothetical protein EYF80_004942 [Liparis tanakae]|uniref:Uncharacterized protein n=1 Tax=Liparis tanakae TaxID=230148 RepID=A0A4Z2J4F1_9TELE|nr:hypothetical protein EYF80_004942 [Liparis tanakae]
MPTATGLKQECSPLHPKRIAPPTQDKDGAPMLWCVEASGDSFRPLVRSPMGTPSCDGQGTDETSIS